MQSQSTFGGTVERFPIGLNVLESSGIFGFFLQAHITMWYGVKMRTWGKESNPHAVWFPLILRVQTCAVGNSSTRTLWETRGNIQMCGPVKL